MILRYASANGSSFFSSQILSFSREFRLFLCSTWNTHTLNNRIVIWHWLLYNCNTINLKTNTQLNGTINKFVCRPH